jgi:NTE family protein
MASLLDTLDPFNLKQQVARLDDVRSLGERFTANVDAVRTARRALMPLPILDRPDRTQTKIFPPFKARPIPSLRNKRIGLLLSGGSGACVAACGVARALEEAGIEPQAISVCSGSALWGSMMAAGLSAQEMVDQSLNWQPEDYLDIQWTRIPRFVLAAMRGFTGLAKGEAIEKLFDRQLWHMTLGETPVPIYSEVYNIDLNRLEVFGSKLTPDLTIAELVRIAIALPMLVESVRVEGHLYADGGVVDVFPAEPLLEHEKLDLVVGVNTILPRGFEGEDISGWTERTMGFMTASRQISYAGHLELARRSARRLGRKLVLIDPVDYNEVHGWRFYDLFIDRREWPRLIMQGYEHATAVLDRYRRSSATRKRRSRPEAVRARA